MYTKSQHKKAQAYWVTSLQYLNLVELVSHEIVKSGNQWVVINAVDEYQEQTKWSDHDIAIPVLFNLYHGIELLVKGFLLMQGQEKITHHNLQDLCNKFKDKYPDEDELNAFFRKYASTNIDCSSSILNQFLVKSDLDPKNLVFKFKDFYEALRYPYGTNFKTQRRYDPLMNNEEIGCLFFQELQDDLQAIHESAVKLGRSFENLN